MTRIKLNSRIVKVFSIFCIVTMSIFSSALAQVQSDKVRFVPTDDEDETTQFLIASHLTDSMCSNSSFVAESHMSDDIIEVLSAGDYFEYQMVSPTGGDFAVNFGMCSKSAASEINVSIYKTETEAWSEGEKTVNVYNNSWTSAVEYPFPFTLEAGVYYTVRMTLVGAGSNIKSLRVDEINGSVDASLSSITLNGDTLAGFDPEVFIYNIALPVNVFLDSFDATANDDAATVEMPEDITFEGNKATATILVTSESGIAATYTVNIAAPISIEDNSELVMSDDLFNNYDCNVSNTKLNSINNGAYVDYYVYSGWDDVVKLTINYANGYDPSSSYLNVSTLGVDDSTWVLNDVYTQALDITYDAAGASQWGSDYAQDLEFYFTVKADEPILLRIYGITDKGNAADVFSLTFNIVYESMDATLSDLQVDGTTILGFDDTKKTFDIAVDAGVTSVDVLAVANDEEGATVEGNGSFTLSGNKSSDTITVTSECGFAIDYYVNFITPIEITEEIQPLAMLDDVFYNYGTGLSNTTLNWIQDGDYLEYYIYSATAKELYLSFDATNGNPDTTYAMLNISTFTDSSLWELDPANNYTLPRVLESYWGDSLSTTIDYNFSLEANVPTFLRLYGVTNAINTCANIYNLTIVTGTSEYQNPANLAPTVNSDILIYGGSLNINITCDEIYVGSSLTVYDITGRLIASKKLSSTSEQHSVSNSGVYIVKLETANGESFTSKCLVK